MLIEFLEQRALLSTSGHPYVLNVTFGTSTSDSNVNLNADIAFSIEVVHSGFGIDGSTLTPQTVELYPTAAGPAEAIQATDNVDGGGGAIVVQPKSLLQPNTSYTLVLTSGIKDLTGATLVPYTVKFTTGTAGLTPDPGVSFTKVAQPVTDGHQYTDIVMGPDGRLWASTYYGDIYAFPILASGNLGTPQLYTTVDRNNGGAETITGITFDPASTATNMIVWVDESEYANSGTASDFTGKIAMLSGPNLSDYQNMVVGLPRSVGNHMTNQLSFGPDGALYVAQGSNTAYGAPDPIWGNRAEDLLNAAILRVDTTALKQRIAAGEGPLDVQTSGVADPYSPYAAGAPLTLYATGIRNAFDIAWINGHLYAPTNGSAAGGNTPASPTNPKLAVTNVPQTEVDYLFEVQQGKYYGHPDPARGQYVFDDGNVDGNSKDPLELPEYPVGTKPDPDYQPPIYVFGLDYSPDGIIQYHGDAFGGALNGHLLITRYSAGKDILDMTLSGSGNSVTSVHDGDTGTTSFDDPLSLVEAPNGDVFVVEYGSGDIVRLSAGASTPTPTPTGSATSYLINCGGTAPYTDHNGYTWSADEDFTGGTVSDQPYTVPGTPDGIVFYDRRTGSDFSYNLPLANGNYTVQLFFTDPTYSASGQRVFNVSAQGKTALGNFDIIGSGGGTAPIARSFDVSVSGGTLNLNFSGVVNNATVSGIMVFPEGKPPTSNSTSTPAPTPTPTPTLTQSVYLINSGGTAPYTDHNGNTWSADEDFTGGAISDEPYTVPGTPDGMVFYDRRTGSDFGYDLPIADGTYTVQLFFTDPIYSSAGERVFDVSAQGRTVLGNFDIIAAGGGMPPIARAFQVTVTDGMITLDFTGVVNDATVSGIQVLK